MRFFTIAVLAAQAASAPQTTFRSGVEVVELDVSVTRGGVPVAGLTARNFALTDNGVAQDVESVTLEHLPLSVTLVLDASQSVAGDRLRHLVQAGEGLTAALRPEDRAALITFSHAVDLRVPMTGDMRTIRTALGAMSGSGATSLRDAVHLALQLQPHDHTRPLVLVFTDGHDTASWLTEDAAIDSARRAGVVIHAVRVASDSFLDRLTQTAGGRTWSATSNRQLQELFTRALDEMRARYLLTYTPRGVRQPGWHELKVKLKTGGADVTARRGYFVSGAPYARPASGAPVQRDVERIVVVPGAVAASHLPVGEHRHLLLRPSAMRSQRRVERRQIVIRRPGPDHRLRVAEDDDVA